jgi:hypothetical protein
MKIAKLVVLDPKAGTVTIDGAELGYYLAQEPIEAVAFEHGLHIIRIPILCEALEMKPAIPPAA